MTLVDERLHRLHGVKKTSTGWVAKCPGHDDKVPSLAISIGQDGRILACCHAGCSIENVTSAIGWTPKDLFGDNGKASKTAPTTRKGKVYRSVNEIAAALLRTPELRGGKVTQHRYTDSFMVLRFDYGDGKTCRPAHRNAKGWHIGDPDGLLPLYRLGELPPDGTVFVVEGEKDCDAAWSLGLPSVTSAHGSKSARKTDWSPLQGRNCVILADADEAGRKYADTVASLLYTLDCSVRIIPRP